MLFGKGHTVEHSAKGNRLESVALCLRYCKRHRFLNLSQSNLTKHVWEFSYDMARQPGLVSKSTTQDEATSNTTETSDCHIRHNLLPEKGNLGMAARIRCLCSYSCKPPYSHTSCLDELAERFGASHLEHHKSSRPIHFIREAAKCCVQSLARIVSDSYKCPESLEQTSVEDILHSLCREFCQRAQLLLGILSQLLKLHGSDDENSGVLLEDVEIQIFVSAVDQSLISFLGEVAFRQLDAPFRNNVRRFILSSIANSSARSPRRFDGCVVCALFQAGI